MTEPRYRFSVEHTDDNGYTTFSNTLEFTAEVLPDVVGNFELFLKGAGFAFDGHVDISSADYTQQNTYNNLPGQADIRVKRPADTEGGSLE